MYPHICALSNFHLSRFGPIHGSAQQPYPRMPGDPSSAGRSRKLRLAP